MTERAASEQPGTRTEVVLGVVGPRAEALRGSVVELLRAELVGMGLSLVERSAARALPVWASEAVRSERTLLAILLDARSDQGWRLVIIDAGRARAIVRDLPGGIRQDAASIEAVVSIAASAASALRDGLEVASSPLAAVVDGPPPPKSARGAVSNDVREAAPRLTEQRSFLHGSVGVSMASFSPEATVTHGMALALGVAWRAQLEARVFGTLFWPARIHTEFGEFAVNRAQLGAAAGPVLHLGGISLVPEAGVVAERLRRSDTAPAAGVVATEARALHRVGVLLALRLRLPLIKPVSAELLTGAAYFGRSVQFSAKSPTASPLAEVWPVAAMAQLGLDIVAQ